MAEDIPLIPREALSGVFGSMSLAAWIFLFIPQLIENYKQGSADGISLAFLAVWFVGDLTNFLGAIWAGLVPTVIALAIYFCFADLVLIGQCLYYRFINAHKTRREQSRTSAQSEVNDTEEEPLLSRQASNLGLPGSQRRSSGSSRRNSHGSNLRRDSLPNILEENESSTKVWVRNILSILVVCAAGAIGWTIAWKSGVWSPTPIDQDEDIKDTTPLGALILGYVSAVCYLGWVPQHERRPMLMTIVSARIPQIVKNYRDRSCEGLSLLFFMLSLLGNLTYGASILCHSTTRNNVIKNLPWLIGSLGTMIEDVGIFIQFHLYSKEVSAN
ncbi:MAG: hypothetical protein M1833_004891 [Piccolia ochrophora]|nr:MAG: hypothetical protein M1833_004891 [Piccolia ochrophora]